MVRSGARSSLRLAGVVILATLGLLGALAVAVYFRPLSFADAFIRFNLWRAGAHSKFLTVSGHRLHYYDAPAAVPGGGTPLLLIHGLGARALDWSPLIPGFVRAGYHVYAPDLPGYGLSDRPDWAYTITDEETAVVGFLEAVHLDHTDVVGWSMGGWIALKLTADHPELVQKLVLYDAAGLYFPMNYDGSLFTPTNATGVDRLFQHLTPKQTKLPSYIVRDLLRRIELNAWVVHRNVASMTGGKDLMEFRLHEIHAPTFILWGADDTLIPSSTGKRMAAGIHGASFLTLPDCGHLMPSECAGAALPPTLKFLRSEDPPQFNAVSP